MKHASRFMNFASIVESHEELLEIYGPHIFFSSKVIGDPDSYVKGLHVHTFMDNSAIFETPHNCFIFDADNEESFTDLDDSTTNKVSLLMLQMSEELKELLSNEPHMDQEEFVEQYMDQSKLKDVFKSLYKKINNKKKTES